MRLLFKPHLLVLLCSTGLFAASGVLYVKSRAPDGVNETPLAAQASPVAQPASVPAYTPARIDQWVAPVALYPDPLLAQILMASTYPASVIQAAQWSQDNPQMQGDAAIRAVSGQPWDASVKSLVAFPQLMSLLGENPPWVQNLGDAFLAQPKDVMDSVQRLRALAQQTGALKTTPQQKVTTTTRAAPLVTAAKTATPSPASQTIIKIEPADPQVVYVPTYNPATVYGAWPAASYPPVSLPPPGQQFANSFVKGFGYSLGVATTYALFSSIDWDDDHHHHDHDHNHDHDHDHDHDHGGYAHNGDNITINVNNFNKITGERRTDINRVWQHNPQYRNGVPYLDNAANNTFHRVNTPVGLSATQHSPTNLERQRQAAMAQLHNATGSTPLQAPRVTATSAQHKVASQQLARHDNHRGYDSPQATRHPLRAKGDTLSALSKPHVSPHSLQANALSSNTGWRAQQPQERHSRHLSSLTSEQRAADREHLFAHRSEPHEPVLRR